MLGINNTNNGNGQVQPGQPNNLYLSQQRENMNRIIDIGQGGSDILDYQNINRNN
jgi:hypothetical protein